MYLDKEKIINSLTDEDIIKICMDLGAEYPKPDGSGNYIFNTNICHGGDSWKLYYYTDRKMFVCYTCGDRYDIINLVIRAKMNKGITITWYNALKYIGIITNKLSVTEKSKEDNTVIDDWKWLSKLSKHKKKNNTDMKEYNEHILELFVYKPVKEWLDEGISEYVMVEFEIGYYPMQNCITIPVRDINGKFIGLRARYLLKEDIDKGKYRPMIIEGILTKHNLGNTFYGIYQNQKAIRKYKKVFLFEAEKSVLLSHTYYGDTDLSLAMCGSNITDVQIKILIELGVSHVIICFDKEYEKTDSFEAEIYYNKILKKIKPLLNFFTVELVMDRQDLLEFKDSPIDKGFETWNKLLEDKFSVTIKDVIESEEKDGEN